jgi:hypothetical protein
MLSIIKQLIEKARPEAAGKALRMLAFGAFIMMLCAGFAIVIHGHVAVYWGSTEKEAVDLSKIKLPKGWEFQGLDKDGNLKIHKVIPTKSWTEDPTTPGTTPAPATYKTVTEIVKVPEGKTAQQALQTYADKFADPVDSNPPSEELKY